VKNRDELPKISKFSPTVTVYLHETHTVTFARRWISQTSFK